MWRAFKWNYFLEGPQLPVVEQKIINIRAVVYIVWVQKCCSRVQRYLYNGFDYQSNSSYTNFNDCDDGVMKRNVDHEDLEVKVKVATVMTS